MILRFMGRKYIIVYFRDMLLMEERNTDNEKSIKATHYSLDISKQACRNVQKCDLSF